MRMSFVTQLIMPCVMFVLLIFCGQQGYMVYKDGNDSKLLIVFYVQIMPDDFIMQLHRF